MLSNELSVNDAAFYRQNKLFSDFFGTYCERFTTKKTSVSAQSQEMTFLHRDSLGRSAVPYLFNSSDRPDVPRLQSSVDPQVDLSTHPACENRDCKEFLFQGNLDNGSPDATDAANGAHHSLLQHRIQTIILSLSTEHFRVFLDSSIAHIRISRITSDQVLT